MQQAEMERKFTNYGVYHLTQIMCTIVSFCLQCHLTICFFIFKYHFISPVRDKYDVYYWYIILKYVLSIMLPTVAVPTVCQCLLILQ